MRSLLILQLLSCVLLSFSCQKKESKSSPIPENAANAVDANLQNPGTGPGQDPGPEPVPPIPGQPAPLEPAPTEGLTALTIAFEGTFIINQKKRLKAIAHYADPAAQRETKAQWTLVSNEADATLDADGSIIARKPGKVVVRAEHGDKAAEAELNFVLPMLRYKEDQFWVYRFDNDFLAFNNPWDKEAGSWIKRDAVDIPDTARDCLDQAKELFSVMQSKAEIKDRITALLVRGATRQLVFLVNVVPVDDRRHDLRRMDRDAYFWHWTRENVRPTLAFSRFQEGVWVWEVISSPSNCHQPDENEMKRYLDYAATRLPSAQ